MRILSLYVVVCLGFGALRGEGGRDSAGVDEGLRQAFDHAAYALEDSGHGTYSGVNSAQRLALEFSGREARLSHPDGSVSFHLTGYGYGHRLQKPAQAKLTGTGNRVEYQRRDLTEWYVNGSQGLEQGFTLARRPETDGGSEPLVIALSVTGGLLPAQEPHGDAVLFESSTGVVLRYGGLTASDARGRILPSRLEVRGREIRLIVEDQGAQYPLVVDPAWTQPPGLTVSQVVVTSSANPSAYGHGVTLTATITPAAATGIVAFRDGVTLLETRTLSGGQAQLTTSVLFGGAHSLTAYYSGDTAYAPSTSPALSQTVTPVTQNGFGAAAFYGTGANPESVAVGDFNGDGIADLVTANASNTLPGAGNNISVLLGNGDGTFRTAVNYLYGNDPYAVAVGDFNGDGIADIAVTNAGGIAVPYANTLFVLLGNGDGTFQPPAIYPVGGAPTSVVVGDFNGDGIADLAVGSAASFNVTVLLGNGDGTFQSGVSYVSGGPALSLAVGDFDGDGKADLVSVDGPGGVTVSVLLGNGDGTFQAAVSYSVATGPASVAVGDFNGDGKADLVTAGYSNNVNVLLGNGDGTFQAAVNYATGITSVAVAVGDFNGDGKADLITANYGDNNVSVLPGNGDGTFQAAVNYAVATGPASVAVGDFNGDGRMDVVTTNGDANTGFVSVLLGLPPAQTIVFGALSDVAFGTLPFTIGATASSGLAVSFASTTPGVCTVAGTTVTVMATGACTIQATQAGNTNWAAATPVNQSFQVTQTGQTITFGAPSNQSFGTAPVSISATASSGLAVGFASTTPAVCAVSGAAVTLVSVGACTIQATQAGNTNYAAATPVNESFQVTQGSQTITFGALSNQSLGTTPFTVGATASSGLTVSFASTTSSVCTVSGSIVTLVAVGTCAIGATQAGNTNYAAAAPVNQSFQVTARSQGSQTITFGALSNLVFGSLSFTVGATASSGLTVRFNSQTTPVCRVFGTTVALVAAGTCTIQATQAGNANWAAATPVNQSFQITPRSQTITFAALSNRAFGSAPFTVGATASSGLAVSFTSQTTPVCTVSGTTVTLVAAGACTIQATQAGNANWGAATPVNQSFQVTPGSQNITFAALSSRLFSSAPFTVGATASSGLAVSFTSQTTPVCTVSGTTVTLVAAGACTIQATQAGNTNWGAATPVNRSFQVTQRGQIITFGALSNRALGTPPFTVGATASSGLAVSFNSQTAPVCTVSGTTVTLVAAGTCRIQATQAGNTDYAAATPTSRSFQVR